MGRRKRTRAKLPRTLSSFFLVVVNRGACSSLWLPHLSSSLSWRAFPVEATRFRNGLARAKRLRLSGREPPASGRLGGSWQEANMSPVGTWSAFSSHQTYPYLTGSTSLSAPPPALYCEIVETSGPDAGNLKARGEGTCRDLGLPAQRFPGRWGRGTAAPTRHLLWLADAGGPLCLYYTFQVS